MLAEKGADINAYDNVISLRRPLQNSTSKALGVFILLPAGLLSSNPHSHSIFSTATRRCITPLLMLE